MFREKKHDLVFMKIAENHIMFFFSLLKPDHGLTFGKKHDLVFMKIAENHIMFFFLC